MNHSGSEKYVADLTQLFREQGPHLYSGEHTLCLTTSCLHSLQKKFTALRELSPSKPVPTKLARIQDLYECLHKIKKLKLISDRKTIAPSLVNVDLSHFRDLHTLVLKRVPINTLTGLQRLREQLQVMKIQRSHVTSLDEILVHCGRDNAQAFSWSSLKELDLSGNELNALGECLNYLPQVQRVDFSNNKIGNGVRSDGESSYNSGDYGSINSIEMSSSTEEHCQSLEGLQLADSIEWLHLGFNRLTCPPVLGDRAKFNLKVLILRDNQLKSIAGLEVLERLVELDLCNNLLSQHSELRPLKKMHFLRMLYLSGNPLCYDPRHRILTAHWLADLHVVTHTAATNFLLDNKKLSFSERKALSIIQPDHFPSSSASASTTPASSFSQFFSPKKHPSPSPSVVSAPAGSVSTGRPIPVQPFVEESEELLVNLRSLPNTPLLVSQSSGTRKVREVTFDDEITTDKPTAIKDKESLAVVPPINKDRIMKYEDLRKQLDNTWLSTAQSSSRDGLELSDSQPPVERGRSSKRRNSKRQRSRKSTSPVSQDTTSLSNFLPLVPDQHVLPLPSQGLNPIKRDGESDCLPNSLLEEPLPDSHPRPDSYSPSMSMKSPAPEPIASNSGYSIIQMSSDNEDVYLDENIKADFRGLESTPPSHRGSENPPSEREQIVGLDQVMREQSPEAETGPSPDELEEKYTVEVWDSGTEEDSHSDSIFLSISDKFLQEIDATRGEVKDQVDLKCLRSVRVEEKTWRERDNSRVLVLHFSQVRRDRRRREYLLVEDSDERAIMERLEPVVERNRSMTSETAKLECLKCQRIITMSEAVDIAESPVSLTAMMQDSSSSYDWSNTRLKKLCPFCQEPFLMLLDSEPSASFSLPNSSPSLVSKKVSPQLMVSTNGQPSAQPLAARPPQLSTCTDSSKGFSQTGSHPGNTVRSPSPSLLDLSYSYHDYATSSSMVVASRKEGSSALSHPSPVADVRPFVYQASKPASKGEKEERKITFSPGNTDAGVCLDQDGLNYTRQSSLDIVDSIAEAMGETRLQMEPTTQLLVGGRPQKSLVQQRHSPQMHLLGTNLDSAAPLQSLASCSSSTSYRSPVNSHSSTNREVERATSPLECHSHSKMRRSCPDKQPFDDPIYQDSALTTEVLDSDLHSSAQTRGDKIEPKYSWHLASSDSDGQQSRADSPSFNSGSRVRSTEPSISRSSFSRRIMIPTSTRHHADMDQIAESPFTNDDDLMSSSVPLESKVKAYFFGSRDKQQREKPKKNPKKKGHSRSHSVEYLNKKVPPLPPGMIQQHKAHLDFQDSLGKKDGGSQLSVESVHSDSKNEEEGPNSSGVDRQVSSGSSEEKKPSTKSGKRFGRFSVSFGKTSKKSSSLPASETLRPASPVIPYRDEDPTYLHNNFTLYLDMEVFDVDKKEHFELAFKSPMVSYGDWKEVDTFLIVSDRNAYLYRITAPESIQPQNWLELMTTLPLKNIVYIDIGVGYQSLRLEVKDPTQCYTFLVRHEAKCRKFFDKLSFVVSDVSRPSLKSVGVVQFSVVDIREPSRALREALLHHYDHLSHSRAQPISSDKKEDDLEQLELFLLAHQHQPACNPAQVPVTVVLTNLHIYLGMDNPQWPLPKLHPLPDREDLMPPFSAVTRKEITDVEKMILYDDQPCQYTLQFFSEDMSHDDTPSWTILLKDAVTVTKFVKCISRLWEKDFQQPLPIIFR